jgi:hypothetical protein
MHAPRCLIKALTGYDCPFCGFQRSVWALVRGNFVDAFMYNPYLYIISPYLIMVILCVLGIIPRQSSLCKALYSRASIISAAILTISWWIARNLFDCLSAS